MIRPGDVSEGRLTPAAIERLCGEFERIALAYAGHWARRYNGRVCLHDLESEAVEQVWRSLEAWRESGASLEPWVKHGIWIRMRAVAKRENDARKRSREVALPTRKFRRAELTLPSREGVDPVATEREAVAAAVIEVARAELDDADWQILDRVVMGHETDGAVAVDLGMSHQRVQVRRSGLIDRLRRIVARHPSLMRHDDRGVLAGPDRKGPRFRRVTDRRSVYGFRWIAA